MKKFFFLFLVLTIVNNSFAQYKINVSEKSENLGGANHNAFSVMIYELDAKEVEKAWKKEMFGDDANTSEMGENNFDLYAKAIESDKGVELCVSIDLGGAFLSSSQHSSQAKYIKDLMYKFAVEETKEGVQGIIKAEEKIQDGLEKQQKDLEKGKEKLERDIEAYKKAIEDAKKAIEQAKKDIEQNGKDQIEKQKEIVIQLKVVEDVVAKEKAVK